MSGPQRRSSFGHADHVVLLQRSRAGATVVMVVSWARFVWPRPFRECVLLAQGRIQQNLSIP